jgi:2-aminoadipate transaminase
MYASRISRLTGSVAREILSHANNKDILSFAGGLPAPEAFEGLLLSEAGVGAFQYGSSEGETALRECFARRFRGKGIHCDYTQVLITSGAQQGIDLISKLFIDEGCNVVVEKPTYLAAIQSFHLFGAELKAVELEPDGIDLKAFEKVLSRGDIRFVYLGPSFQNPTGICYSLEKRKAVAALLDRYDVTLIEDDPYGELNYAGLATDPICSFLKKAKWIHLSTISKILAPGLRTGCLVCSKEFFPYLLKLKQAADLHSNRFSQAQVLQWLEDEDALTERIATLRNLYRGKRDAMRASLERHFSELADWNVADGGLFFWLRLKAPLDMRALLQRTIVRGVAFMPGSPFFSVPEAGAQYMRLNFSNPPTERVDEGLATLASELGS